MTSPTLNPIDGVYHRLEAAGANQRFVQETALPGWWDDDDALDPSTFAQALTLLSRNLAVTLESLQTPDARIEWKASGPTRFKRRPGTTDADLQWAHVISARAAELALQAAVPGFITPDQDPRVTRAALLRNCDRVTLEPIVDFCWAHGIPVLHVAKFPTGVKKMDGIAARILERPVIVLSKNEHDQALQAFILAHELGHIASGHLPDNGFLVDEEVGPSRSDPEEMEADSYASTLLLGDPPKRIPPTRRSSPAQLAKDAVLICDQSGVDPRACIWNYGWAGDKFAVAHAAIRQLDPTEDAISLIRKKMLEHLDLSKITTENAEHLLRVTGADFAE